jgi:hypothetical protein
MAIYYRKLDGNQQDSFRSMLSFISEAVGQMVVMQE